jgi:sucrose phosphorylase
MNIDYFDAHSDPAKGESIEVQVNRFMVAQAIMLALPGVPGIYFHSLFGSRNDRDAALETGINRRINRQKFLRSELEAELGAADSLRSRVFNCYRDLLEARRSHAAFSPQAEPQVMECDASVFAVLRAAGPGGDWVLCLHNVTNQPVTLNLAVAEVTSASVWTEMISGRVHPVPANGTVCVSLRPYEVNWFAAQGPRPQASVAVD